MTAGEVYDLLDKIAPFRFQDGFDNAGLLVGGRDVSAEKAAVCLDITNDIVDECARSDVKLIISHHPVIFNKIRTLDDTSPVYRLIKNGIAAVCAHTNLDMVRGGISDMMYELMGFGSPENAPVLDVIHEAEGIGYGRIAYLDFGINADGLAESAKNAFGCRCVKYCDGGKIIKNVALCSGAGSDAVYRCIKLGIDAIITGDVKHHAFVDAKNAGITVIDAGHYGTENIVCGYLVHKLSESFPDCEFFIPSANAEVCRYI